MSYLKMLRKIGKKAPPPIFFIVLGLSFVFITPRLPKFQLSTTNLLSLPLSSNGMSIGNKLLIMANARPQKKEGVKAFASGDYQTAITKFQESLRKYPNDPETVIYLQNSQLNNSGCVWKIAVSVPISSNLNIAQEILRGVAMSQEEYNHSTGIKSKGECGLQVQIIDDRNQPEMARQIATELVKDKQVLERRSSRRC